MGAFRTFKRGVLAATVGFVTPIGIQSSRTAAANESFQGTGCGSIYNASSTLYYTLTSLINISAGTVAASWNATTTSYFETGLSGWELLRDAGGGKVFTHTAATYPTSGRWIVLRGIPGSMADVNSDGEHDGQSATCIGGGRVLQIASYESQASTFQRTSAHEIGHAWGVMHSGRCDSRPVTGSSSTFYDVSSAWPYSPTCTGQNPLVSSNCGAASDRFPISDSGFGHVQG